NLEDWRESIDVFGHMLETRRLGYAERLPRVEEALSRADVQGLVDRKLELDARLNGIEAEHDALALATADEFRLWGAIAMRERTRAHATGLPEAGEARRKKRLLKGVLQWRLEKEFKARLWTLPCAVRDTGEAIDESHGACRSV